MFTTQLAIASYLVHIAEAKERNLKFYMLRLISFYGESLIGGYFLWLGLYIITRGLPSNNDEVGIIAWWQSATFAAGLSFVLTSWFILGLALRSILTDQNQFLFWIKATWWTTPFALVLWIRAIWLLPQNQYFHPVSQRTYWFLWGLLVGAAALAYWGTCSELIFHYSAIVPVDSIWADHYYVPPAPPKSHFLLFMLLVLLLSLGLLWRHYKRSPLGSRARFAYRMLGVGAALFVLGAAYSISAYTWWRSPLGEHLGYIVAIGGIVILGYGVVRYNALVAQKIVRQDFVHTLLESGILVGIYLLVVNGVFWLTGTEMPLLLVPFLTYLIIVSTVPMRWYKWLLDQRTLPAWQTRFMWRLTRVRQEVMVAPNKQEALAFAFKELATTTQVAQIEQIRAMVQEEVASIFRHKVFQQDSAMAQSRLFELSLVQQTLLAYCQTHDLLPSLLTESEKAQILRQFFYDFFCSQFSLSAAAPASDEQIETLLLFKSYVEDKIRRQVILEIEQEAGIRIASNGIGGRLYDRYLKNGRSHLAEKIWQQERPLRRR